jgi:serine O-acetyltransferase
MNLSLSAENLCTYFSTQLNTFFPDNHLVKPSDIREVLDSAIDRLHFCFKHVAFNRYCRDGETFYNHLYSDHNVVLLWLLSNTAYKNSENQQLAAKFYYLNKSMHAFDCMYDTKLPDIFLVFHGAGTMLGKAEYNDYFVCLQGCTVGSHKGQYPVFGKGVALTANSSVIGGCQVGNRVSISTRTTVFAKDIPSDTTVYMNFESGAMETKSSGICYAQQFFSTDLRQF